VIKIQENSKIKIQKVLTGKTQRILYLDQLRALAIIAVVCIHVSQLWNGIIGENINGSVALFFMTLGRYGVPIFLTISGVLLLNKEYEIYEFIKKRFPRIILPWLFWIVIGITFTILTTKTFPFFNSYYNGIVFITKHFLVNRWYVWMLIGVYLLIPIINEFVRAKGLKGVQYFLILWLITSIISGLSSFFDFSTGFLDLSFFAGPMGYVLLGYYLHNKKFKYSPNKIIAIGLGLFIAGFLLKFLLLNGGVNLHKFTYYIFQKKSYLEIDIFVMMMTSGIFLTFKYLNSSLNGLTHSISEFLKGKIVKKLILSLSKASYGIYLTHYIMVSGIALMIPKIVKHTSLKWIPFLIVLVLVCSWALIVLISKIPFIKKISGYH